MIDEKNPSSGRTNKLFKPDPFSVGHAADKAGQHRTDGISKELPAVLEAKHSSERNAGNEADLEALADFLRRFGNRDPHFVYDFLQHLSYTGAEAESDLSTCFAVLYPSVARSIQALFGVVKRLDAIIRPYNAFSTAPDDDWVLRWKFPLAHILDKAETRNVTEWIAKVNGIRENIYSIREAIAHMNEQLDGVGSAPKNVARLPARMSALHTFLNDSLLRLEQAESDAVKRHEETQAYVQGGEAADKFSALDEKHVKIRQHSLPTHYSLTTGDQRAFDTSLDMAPRGNRRKSHVFGSCKRHINRFRSMSTYGERYAAYWIVAILSAISIVFTGLAIWKCGPATTAVAVDSNFWSSLSQTDLGYAGVYCIAIPLLRDAQIAAENSFVFKAVLIMSFFCTCIGAIVYHFQTRTSLAFQELAGLLQLLATLMVIEDANTAVTALNLESGQLRDNIEDKEVKIAALSAALHDAKERDTTGT